MRARAHLSVRRALEKVLPGATYWRQVYDPKFTSARNRAKQGLGHLADVDYDDEPSAGGPPVNNEEVMVQVRASRRKKLDEHVALGPDAPTIRTAATDIT